VAVGFDLALAAVDAARSRTDGEGRRPRYLVARSPELPFRDGSFSLVFERGVLHHIPIEGWARYQANVARILRPGGLYLQFYASRPLTPVATLRGLRARARRMLRWGLTPRTGPGRAMRRAATPSLQTIDVHRVPMRTREGVPWEVTVALFKKPR
jgi:SAM-dependent methyltransferase